MAKLSVFYIGDIRFEAESSEELRAAAALLREAKAGWGGAGFWQLRPIAEELLGRPVSYHQLAALLSFNRDELR